VNWSREIPNRPGYYWFRGQFGAEPCEISIEPGPTEITLIMFISDESVHLATDQMGEWCGPLMPPE
jgi:hypothetical protein